MNASGPGSQNDFRRIDLGEAGNVLADAAFEQFNVLGQVTDMRPKLMFVPGADVRAIQPNHPMLRHPYPHQCSGQCRLACGTWTDDSHRATGRYGEAYVFDDRGLRARCRDNQILDRHVPRGRWPRHALGLRLLFVEDVFQAAVLRASRNKTLPATDDQIDGGQCTPQQYGPGKHHACPHLMVHRQVRPQPQHQ
ncbi:hypothetical protein D3C78_837730 [compost metagenome]